MWGHTLNQDQKTKGDNMINYPGGWFDEEQLPTRKENNYDFWNGGIHK